MPAIDEPSGLLPVPHLRNGVAPGAAKDADEHLRRGLEQLRSGEHDRAVAELTAAVLADPARADAFLHRGEAHRSRGDYERALADFDEADRRGPGDLRVLLNRATCCSLLGRYERAVADYT